VVDTRGVMRRHPGAARVVGLSGVATPPPAALHALAGLTVVG
jgi:hypothetical protein